jgi:type IV secretion system protein VirB5
MNKNIFSLLICTVLASNANAITVYDPRAAANAIKQIAETKKQLEQLKANVEQAKALYKSINGTRGIVNLLENPVILSKLPQNYQDLYAGIKNSKNDKWQELYKLTLDGKSSKNTSNEDLRRAYDNSLDMHYQQVQQSYQDTYRRLENLDKLSNKISLTKDPKEIADLQARINAEQVGISTDKMRLELLKEMKVMREEALKQQASNQWHESLDKPFKMPDIHVEIKKPFSN